jgi:prepilin-type N-terminal cleavage/methylation domain-containing protein
MLLPRAAFSLLELLVALGILAMLVTLGIGAGRRSLSGAESADSVARLRSVGQAILLHAGEHNQQLPGPLWPGQVMEYDPQREGRIVRDLAPYLGVEPRDTPYLVDRMIPRAYRHNPTTGPREQLRVYVMNSSVVINGQTNAPFGSLTASPTIDPLRINRLDDLPENEQWMASETDHLHPDVSGAPWKANTPAKPVHGRFRASVNFDGSATLQPVP